MKGIIEVFFNILKKLEDNHFSYMVVGSIASMVYGEPRMTHDLDVVVNVQPKDAGKLEALFSEDEFYCPPIEVIRSEIVHHGQFNLIHHDSGLKIDLVICKESEHARCEFDRKRKAAFWNGNEVFLASPEDVIIKKLEFFRQGESQKHLKDIRGILVETDIDEHYLYDWIKKLGLEKEWRQVG